MKSQSKTATDLTFKAGNLRSLATSLVKLLGNEKAWETARKVTAKFGKDFTVEQAKTLIPKSAIAKTPVAKSGTTTSKKESTLGTITLKADETKNGKIRELLEQGYGLTAIANALGLGYQRVKNVKNAEKRKSGK